MPDPKKKKPITKSGRDPFEYRSSPMGTREDHDEFLELLESADENWGQLSRVYLQGNIYSISYLKKFYDFEETKEVILLRTSFWNEYALAKKTKLKYFYMQTVYTGVCSRRDFLVKLQNEHFCHYLLNPCADYSLELLNVLNDNGVDFYKKMLNLPDFEKMRDKDGRELPNETKPLSFERQMKLYNFKFNILKRLEDRVQGSTVKKIDHTVDNTSVKVLDSGLEEISKLPLAEVNARLEMINEAKNKVKRKELNDTLEADFVVVNEENKGDDE